MFQCVQIERGGFAGADFKRGLIAGGLRLLGGRNDIHKYLRQFVISGRQFVHGDPPVGIWFELRDVVIKISAVLNKLESRFACDHDSRGRLTIRLTVPLALMFQKAFLSCIRGINWA